MVYYFNFDEFCQLSLLVLLKVDRKVLVLFGLTQNFKIFDLGLAKVEKITSYLYEKTRGLG
jgi:hypothetical protein